MNEEYQEYPFRYIIVLLFSLPSFINGMCWVVLSPISTNIQSAYEVSDTLVTLVPMLYMVMYIFVNFPSNWILDTKGIRKGVIIGAVMTALGAGIRCMINLSFTFVLIGQFFCAVGQPFILNAPAKIATYWLKEQNV
jgi:FLVCR family feline leukemia virus subgroup C receptor-related protein